MKTSMFWLFLSIVTLCASLGCAYRAGLEMGRREQPQLISMNKDLMRERKQLQGQVGAIGNEASAIAHDPRTHAHTKLQLERLLEKCQTRRTTES